MNKANAQQQLFLAITFSNTKDIEQAISQGADINGLVNEGNTALTEAILGGMGSPEAVKELLRLGANPDKEDGNGWTPWNACLSRLHDRVVEDEQREIQELLSNYNAKTDGEETVYLWRHALNGSLQEVGKMLEEGVSPNSNLVSILEVAVLSRNVELVQLLLDHGALVDGCSPKDHVNLTPLIHAARKGDLGTVKLLVHNGADVSYEVHEDGNKRTAESYAAEKNHQEVALFLREISGERGFLE